MPTGLEWESVLQLLPGATGYTLLGAVTFLALRYAFIADRRWREEATDHQRTQDQLDDERARRRKVEDQVDELTREVKALKQEVAQLRGAVGGR